MFNMADHQQRDQPEPAPFSDGVGRVVKVIRPHGRRGTSFPIGLEVADTRRNKAEDLHAWFVHLVDTYCEHEPSLLGIEENIVFMGKFKWREDHLAYASVPTLITESTLEEYYLDGGNATYLRLDVNFETLGEPFSHPLAHVHVGDGDSPRFALDGGTRGNVVMDFFDFLYRTYVPNKWARWARREWLREQGGEQRAGEFDQIIQAFREGQFSVLRANANLISRIKQSLCKAKDSFFKSHLDSADREILEYPLSR